MIASERIAALQRRVAGYQAAFATFARIHEELLCMRKRAAVGVAQERVDMMVKLNREVAEVVKRILTTAEDDLLRAETE